MCVSINAQGYSCSSYNTSGLITVIMMENVHKCIIMSDCETCLHNNASSFRNLDTCELGSHNFSCESFVSITIRQ